MFTLLFFILTGFVIFQDLVIIRRYKKITRNEKSLVASVTHDLKTPASAQYNMLKMLLQGQFGKLTPAQYEMVKLTCASTTYTKNLLTTIMSNYELENKTVKLNKTQFDILELTKNIIFENKYLLCDKNLEINFEHKNDKYFVTADKLQIKRVLINLLSNAIKYSIENTIITIKIGIKNKKLCFLIKNKSVNNNKIHIQKLFKKFNKIDSTGQNSSGLGLYISKKIIEKHRGQIFAFQTKNSEFICSFRLPLFKDELSKNYCSSNLVEILPNLADKLSIK